MTAIPSYTEGDIKKKPKRKALAACINDKDPEMRLHKGTINHVNAV